jgi:glycosyltransferase involved in cell wall biosynthesis
VIRVGYIAGEPNPSRAPHLDRIAAHPDLELTVIYAAWTVHRREWSLELEHEPIVLRGPWLPAMRLLHHDYPLTPGIWRLLDRQRFDVLVIGGWSLLATQLAIVWARTHRVPYLLISENHFRESRPSWITKLKELVLPRLVRPAAGQLVTGTLAREHQLHYGARPETITIFPNTVDVEEFGRRADELRARRDQLRAGLGVAEDAVVVTQVSRFIPFKGPDEAIEATARARALTDRRLHLVLVGSGPMRDELERRAAELELDVTFAGWRSGESLLEAYAATDVFILLSRREPWGIVVNEAAACGLPLVLTDTVGAAIDLLVPGENGELVRSGDLDGQAAAVARLAADDGLRARYGARSRELAAPWGYGPSVESFVEAIRRAGSPGDLE